MIAILLLAAGSSSRMRGGDKLLEKVDGMPLLRRQAMAARAVAPVLVALAPDRPERAEALDGLDVHMVIVADAAEGMSASLRAGVDALPEDCIAVVILPADMPDIDAHALRRMVEAHLQSPEAILRGSSADGTPGHPVVFPRRLFEALSRITGDEGARSVVRGEELRLIPLPGQAALTDLDTPEDWAAWRASRS